MGDVERITMLLDNDGSDGMEPLSLPETSGKTDKARRSFHDIELSDR